MYVIEDPKVRCFRYMYLMVILIYYQVNVSE